MSDTAILMYVLTESLVDDDFVKDFLKIKQFNRNGDVVFLTDVSTFAKVIEGRPRDYEFRLIIHEGRASNHKYTPGQMLANELEQHFPNVRTQKLVYITRNQDIFTSQEPLITATDSIRINYNRTYTPGLLAQIPVYTMGSFIDSESNDLAADNIKKLLPVDSPHDFAVMTALFEDENAVFVDKCESEIYRAIHNGYSARFKEAVSLSKDIDYSNKFLLVHQHRMGLVDAALHSAQIISEYNPDFLIMAGVCGGRKNHVKQYDVIVPTTIHDYATGKFQEGKLDSKEYKTYVNAVLISHLHKNKERIILNMRAMIDSSRRKLMSNEFDIHFSDFASGPWVIKTEGFLDDYLVQSVNKDIKGLEMESFSVVRAREIMPGQNKFSLVVKSVMDFTNEDKNDGAFGEIKQGAAYISYLCVRATMPVLLEFRKNSQQWNKN